MAVSVTWLPDPVFISHAIGDIIAIGPHSKGCQFAEGFWSPARRLVRNLHLDPGALRKVYFFQGFEDAALVFGRDRYALGLAIQE